MQARIKEFLAHLKNERNQSEHTLRNYHIDLKQFFNFLKDNFPLVEEDELLRSIDRQAIRQFLAFLYSKSLSRRSIGRKLSTIKSFFKFLKRRGIVEKLPTIGISSPKIPITRPKYLSVDDIFGLIHNLSQDDFFNLRDFTIVEVLYGTGIRVSELVSLNEADLNLNEASIKIRGKRKKERIVLFGEPALKAIKKYLEARRQFLFRKKLIEKTDEPLLTYPLFLNNRGRRISSRGVHYLIRKITRNCGILRHISPHTLRHTFATHLLDGGADLVSISELLGHENLSSTQIYTHISTAKLLEIYDKTHPRAKKAK